MEWKASRTLLVGMGGIIGRESNGKCMHKTCTTSTGPSRVPLKKWKPPLNGANARFELTGSLEDTLLDYCHEGVVQIYLASKYARTCIVTL